MREVLLTVCPGLIWAFALFNLACFVILLIRRKKTHNSLYLLCAMVAAGLFYDSFMLALGVIIQTESGLFRFLSQLRFVSHGALIPVLFSVCAYALHAPRKVKWFVWCFTTVMMLLGIAEGFCSVLEVQNMANVFRYTASAALTPGWATAISSALSFGTVIPLMIVGVIVWSMRKTSTLFLAGFLMFAFSALGPATGNTDLIFFISMAGEILMIFFLLLFCNFDEEHKGEPLRRRFAKSYAEKTP